MLAGDGGTFDNLHQNHRIVHCSLWNLYFVSRRAIFWFLATLSAAILVLVILFSPETLRSLVGNGSVPAKGVSRTVWSIYSTRRKERDTSSLE